MLIGVVVLDSAEYRAEQYLRVYGADDGRVQLKGYRGHPDGNRGTILRETGHRNLPYHVSEETDDNLSSFCKVCRHLEGEVTVPVGYD